MTTELEDRVALRALVDTYSTSVILRDEAGLASVFAPDAVWELGPPFNVRHVGAETIARDLTAGLRAFEFVFQMTHSVVIKFDRDRAALRCVINEVARSLEGDGLFLLGIYEDEAVRRPEGWRFARRYFRTVYVDTNPLPGQGVPPPEGLWGPAAR